MKKNWQRKIFSCVKLKKKDEILKCIVSEYASHLDVCEWTEKKINIHFLYLEIMCRCGGGYFWIKNFFFMMTKFFFSFASMISLFILILLILKVFSWRFQFWYQNHKLWINHMNIKNMGVICSDHSSWYPHNNPHRIFILSFSFTACIVIHGFIISHVSISLRKKFRQLT